MRFQDLLQGLSRDKVLEGEAEAHGVGLGLNPKLEGPQQKECSGWRPEGGASEPWAPAASLLGRGSLQGPDALWALPIHGHEAYPSLCLGLLPESLR